jgi:hypothetical protein
MTTEERLAKLEREVKALKSLVDRMVFSANRNSGGSAAHGVDLDVPTFMRRNIGARSSRRPRDS